MYRWDRRLSPLCIATDAGGGGAGRRRRGKSLMRRTLPIGAAGRLQFDIPTITEKSWEHLAVLHS
jgi:hypothetical protein